MSNFELLLLVGEASLFQQLILLLLVVLCYFTLWYILRKRLTLRAYENHCLAFEQAFWAGGNIGLLEERVRSGEFGEHGLAHVFLFGQEEFHKVCESEDANDKDKDNSDDLILEGVRRALDIAEQQEEEFLLRHMQFLATVASVSPYIGLLGTVLGIIKAFQLLTQASQASATIALVAPAIAEALLATAMGLLAAIPALIAYNYFSTRLDKISARIEKFSNHYLNILHRNL